MIPSISNVTPSLAGGNFQKPPDAAHDSPVVNDDQANESSLRTAKPAEANKNTFQLSESDLKIVQQLKTRDTEVKTHELAHLAAAGGIATSGASFEYQQGPDGIRYAIGGEVNIDTSPVPGNPAATLRKADTIKSAALAPAQPSAQDLQVAASATAMAAKASVELMTLTRAAQQGDKNSLGSQLDVSA